MSEKIYTSFEAIDFELEILKLEKEISYQKMVLSFEKAKDSISILDISVEIISYFKEKIIASTSSILMNIVPFIFKLFTKRKEAN
ncbi:MAG: DUF6327 family protein [Flavobacterium sp.]